MDKNQENTKKKSMSIRTVTRGGGGLAGIILLCGALAAAALVSTFAFKRKQNSKKGDKDDCLSKCSEGDGLSFLVQGSLSPQLNHDHRLSNETGNDFVSREIMILDDASQVNGGIKDKEIEILEKGRESLLRDESVTSIAEFSVQFADTSLLRMPEEMKRYDGLKENAVLKPDKKIRMANSNQVGVVDNDQHILLKEGIKKNIEGNNKLDDLVAANGIQLSERLEFTTICGDQDILCSDSKIIQRNENGICDVNKTSLLLEDKKYYSDKSSPELNSFPSNGLEVQEFSFLLLDSPPSFSCVNLIKDDLLQTALNVEDDNTMEKDRLANEVVSYKIMSEKKPRLSNNVEVKSFNDDSENDVAEGEEILVTGLVDIGDGRKIDAEALETIGTENFELENNQQPASEEDNCYNDNVNREEIRGSTEDEENSDSVCDEEYDDDEGEESSETTGGSSPDSNPEAIWPLEQVQEFLRKLKPIKENHNYMEIEREDGHSNFNKHILKEDEDSFEKDFSNKFTEEITALRQPTMFFNLKFWFFSLLVPFLLLLWFLSSQLCSPDSPRCHLQ